jgi:RNA polymerase sporulation-specific sigma factor
VFEGVESRLLMDIIPSNICDPETEFIQKEQSNIFQEVFNTELSALERNAIALQLQGYAFNEIADLLSVHVKSVDNALWRAKKKLKQAINY